MEMFGVLDLDELRGMLLRNWSYEREQQAIPAGMRWRARMVERERV